MRADIATASDGVLSPHQEELLVPYQATRRSQIAGMLSQIELEITTACNLKCYNCDRSSRQAASTEVMGVGQVARFIDESLELGWRWRKIALLGGEPTLHPRLDEILGELDRYRTRFPATLFQLVSNGYGPGVAARLARLPEWICIRNTRKRSIEQDFDAYNVAPIDLARYAEADFSSGCSIPYLCGMGLTRHGYYPCGAGASIDRVFGIDRAVRSLRLVTPEGLIASFNALCRYCGHFHGQKTRVERMSASWTEAYARWHSRPPRLELYASAESKGDDREVARHDE
jgi:hypothetical protein